VSAVLNIRTGELFDDADAADAGHPLEAEVARLNAAYADASPHEILDVAVNEVFDGRIALVSSFGAEAAVLLALVAETNPSTPVVFLETGKHFAQTLSYRRQLQKRLGLTDVRDVKPDADDLAATDSKGTLWRSDTDACCHIRKVLPLDRALAGFDAWITGRKRFHGGGRARLPLFERSGEKVKVNPLARADKETLDRMIAERDLPAHPLIAQGFPSIGCWPCTRPSDNPDDLRAGRWAGQDKAECGIHVWSPGGAQ